MHQVYVDQDACKGTDECGICAWVCPTEVFDTASHLTSRGIAPPVVARIADCVGCENCMLYCPDLAVVVVKDARQAVRGTQEAMAGLSAVPPPSGGGIMPLPSGEGEIWKPGRTP